MNILIVPFMLSVISGKLLVASFTEPIDVRSAIESKGWVSVFNGHGAKWQSGDTTVFLVDTALIVQISGVTDEKILSSYAEKLLSGLSGSPIKIKSQKLTSRFFYQYLDSKGFPSVGIIQSVRTPPVEKRDVEPVQKAKIDKRRIIHDRLLEPQVKAKNPDSSVVIMFNSNSSGWSAIDTLHEVYSGQYVDLEFTSLISERIDELRAIKPKYIIVVADPSDLTPDFMYDADTTTRVIDDDEYHDAVLAFVTGYSSNEATALAAAPDNTNSAVLTIANPDGSLLASGYSGVWLANHLENDANHLGGERLYVNTTSSDDPDITASNIASELNNLHRGNVLFNDHGWPYGWSLRDYPGDTSNDVVAGFYSDLKTWRDSNGDGYLDAYYDIENGQHAFVFADACLTLRLSGARANPWGPWETSSSNMSSVPIKSIALAWMEDSPGFYIGSHSVSYGSAFLKFVILQMTRNGLTPAEALTYSKDVYNYVIGRETADDDPSDGTTDDYLEYLRHEFMGIGKPTWRDTIVSTSSPDYETDVSAPVQQDQLPDNDRGYIYTGTPIKWLATVTFTVNEELVHEPIGASSEDSMPFNYLFVKNVGGNGSSVWTEAECALLADFVYPGHGLPSKTDSIAFANGDPSDPDWHLYQHPWYGAGNTNAYEIFKAGINEPDRIILILGAGVTDADNDGSYEWRVNSGYTKSFDIYIYTPAVTDSVIDTTSMGDDHWLQRVVVSNRDNSMQVSEVIVSLPVNDSNVTVDSVLPADRVHDVVVTSDSGKAYNIEFTVSAIDSGSVDTFEVYYTVAPSRVSEPPTRPSETPALMAEWNGDNGIVRLVLPRRGMVRLAVYDAAGRRMAVLFDGQLDAGQHTFRWEPCGSGVYTVIAETPFGVLTRKFVVVR